MNTTPTILLAASLPKLRTIINTAVITHDLDRSWRAPKTADATVLIEHIDAMCNEHNLRVNEETGALEKPAV